LKYASILFALALIGFAGIANAHEVSFTFNYNNQNSYYACSYAEGQASKTLTLLGADNVVVDCHGGIENGTLWPISMSGSFLHSEKGERTVVLKGRESCDFNVKLINTILASMPHEKVVSQNTCWDSEGSYRFEINLK
jgi:hypothetical protein